MTFPILVLHDMANLVIGLADQAAISHLPATRGLTAINTDAMSIVARHVRRPSH